jgi:hypothetical protein
VITTADDLPSVLFLDFSLARFALREARLRQALKDTPTHREAIAQAWARIDALLDMYVEAGGARPLTGDRPLEPGTPRRSDSAEST